MLITAPLRVTQSKKKLFTLNLNVYRNAHFHVLNKAKVEYKKAIQDQVDKLPKMQGMQLTLTLYPKTRRLCDISNILSIHDKFFCDAVVESGKLPDDNYNHLKQITYRMGKIDKENPRVEIEVEEIK